MHGHSQSSRLNQYTTDIINRVWYRKSQSELGILHIGIIQTKMIWISLAAVQVQIKVVVSIISQRRAKLRCLSKRLDKQLSTLGIGHAAVQAYRQASPDEGQVPSLRASAMSAEVTPILKALANTSFSVSRGAL